VGVPSQAPAARALLVLERFKPPSRLSRRSLCLRERVPLLARKVPIHISPSEEQRLGLLQQLVARLLLAQILGLLTAERVPPHQIQEPRQVLRRALLNRHHRHQRPRVQSFLLAASQSVPPHKHQHNLWSSPQSAEKLRREHSSLLPSLDSRRFQRRRRLRLVIATGSFLLLYFLAERRGSLLVLFCLFRFRPLLCRHR
jgi:hypothetical protein